MRIGRLRRGMASYKSVELVYGMKAREGLFRGIEQLSHAVGLTLGPRGRHVAIDYEMGTPKITKDGVTVAKHFRLPGRLENIGAQLVKASAHESNEYAGDGTTTTTILTHSIVQQGLQKVARGAHPLAIKRGIDAACAQAVDYILRQAVPVTREEEVVSLAEVATNHDKQLARLISEAVIRTGKQGLVTVEEGSTKENRLVFSEGMVVNRGFSSPHFITDMGAQDVRLESPLVLTISNKMKEITCLLPLLEKVMATQRSLAIVAEDVDTEIQSLLIMNLQKGTMSSCAINYPGMGWNLDMIEDIAFYTGAKLFSIG